MIKLIKVGKGLGISTFEFSRKRLIFQYPYISLRPLFTGLCTKIHFNNAVRISKIFNLSRKCITTVSTTIETQTQNNIIISQSYINRYHEVIKNTEQFIRLTVEGGGCSGFQYEFTIDKDIAKDDVIFTEGGAQLVIDEVSLDILQGATVEFREELVRSSFVVTNIPRAEKGCSCGESFALKF